MKKIKQFLEQRSIQQKWTLVSALTIVISYAFISGILYVAISNWLLNDEERSASSISKDVQSFLVEQGPLLTVQDLQKNTTLMNAIIDREQTVRIYNFDHVEILRINDTLSSPENKPTKEQIDNRLTTKTNIFGSDAIVVYSPIQIGIFKGYMELVHPLAKYNSMMNYMLTLLLILGIGAIIVATTLSRYIASLLLKPIQQLRNSMLQVKEQGIENPTIIKTNGINSKDEISELLAIYNDMLNELKMSFRRQQQFVQDASHELRTPIQAIEGHLSLIDRWGKHEPEVLEESLNTAIIEVRKMKKLMEELLLLARNEEPNKKAVCIASQVIEDVKQEVLYIHPSSSIEILKQGEEKKVSISEEALSQVIRNLFENAITYSIGKAYINVSIVCQESFVQIIIKDKGIGIEQKHLPHIFDRFYRVDDARNSNTGSTGLGLSITKMLAQKYEVQLHVESEVGVGTAFTVRIPIEEVPK